MTVNLLAVLNTKNQDSPLVKDFLDCLPEDTEVCFNSTGYVGNLESNLNSFSRNNQRYFAIFQMTECPELNTEYFDSEKKAKLIHIPDMLKLKIDFKRKDTEFFIGDIQLVMYQGHIKQIVQSYREVASQDPKEILTSCLDRYASIRERKTRRSLLHPSKKIIHPTYVSVGLETLDGKYLLATTGAKGPYIGKI